jgi:hypothetical protein
MRNRSEGTPVQEVYLDFGTRAVRALALASDRPHDRHARTAGVFEEQRILSFDGGILGSNYDA